MRKYDLQFEEKDIIQNPAFRWEMEQKTGQPLSPCVEVDGEMLTDVSGEEVEAYMIEKGLVSASGNSQRNLGYRPTTVSMAILGSCGSRLRVYWDRPFDARLWLD